MAISTSTSTSTLTDVPDGLAGTVLLPTDDHSDDVRRPALRL
jgi:hypothetical protein